MNSRYQWMSYKYLSMASAEGQSGLRLSRSVLWFLVAQELRVALSSNVSFPVSTLDTSDEQILVLAAVPNYQVSRLTRDVSNPQVRALADAYDNVCLIVGSYTTPNRVFVPPLTARTPVTSTLTASARESRRNTFGLSVHTRSPSNAHLRHFIYPGSFDRFGTQLFNMDEKYRNSHNIVGLCITTWLTAQPTSRLPWTIIEGGVYAEMLHTLLRPRINPSDGSADFIAPMHPTSTVPLIPVANYAAAVKWALEHPERSVGSYVDAGSFRTTFPQIADAFTRVTGKPARFVPVDIDTWTAGAKAAGIDPEERLPRGPSASDETTFTFRKSFGAWWALWRDGGAEINFHNGDARQEEMDKLADEVLGEGRIRDVEGWMRRTGYDGHVNAVTKGNDTTYRTTINYITLQNIQSRCRA